ncbi:hypothetical protein HOY82DRAFT_129682 [Tuber indicum]|nr:hypothetical protein HOY82DRAFT_129682 [Tuber indicum]
MKSILIPLLIFLQMVHANHWLPQTSSAPCTPSKNSTWTLKTYPCAPQTSNTTSTFCCLPHEICQISVWGKAQCLAKLTIPYHPPRPANCSGMAECPLFCKQSEFACGNVCCPNGKACLSEVCFENLPVVAEPTASDNANAQEHSIAPPPPLPVPAVSHIPAEEGKEIEWVSGKSLTAVAVVVVLFMTIALGITWWLCLYSRRWRKEGARNSPAGLRRFPIVRYVNGGGDGNGVGQWVDAPLPVYTRSARVGEITVWK